MRCLIFLLVIFSASVFAADLDVAEGADKYAAELIFTILTLVKIVAYMMGLGYLVKAGIDMARSSAEGAKK